LILGISTMLSQDIYKEYINPNASDQTILFISRATIIIIAALSLVFVSQNMNSLILKWSFLSMGLRGATICFPLVAAILFPGFVKAKAGLIAIGLAPACTIGWAILGNDAIDPLYVGLVVSLAVLILGSMCSAKSSHELGGS
jgi:SSS family solute:Na+ symporter